ncbi:hypothetical protein V8E51_011842 [Hyaloscypha variabilis]
MFCNYVFFALLSSLVLTTACGTDNCGRAFSKSLSSASAFCHTYTVAAASAIPTFASPCSSSSSRLPSFGLHDFNHSAKKLPTKRFSLPLTSTPTPSISTCPTATATTSSTVTISVPGSTVTITGKSVLSCSSLATSWVFQSERKLPLIAFQNPVTSTPLSCTTTTSSPTSTAAITTTCNPGGSQPTIFLIAQAPGSDINGANPYLYPTGPGPPGLPYETALGYKAGRSNTLFTFNDACNLVSLRYLLYIIPDATQNNIFFSTAADIAAADGTPAVCNLTNGLFQCTDFYDTIWVYCPDPNDGYLFLAIAGYTNCAQFQLMGQQFR